MGRHTAKKTLATYRCTLVEMNEIMYFPFNVQMSLPWGEVKACQKSLVQVAVIFDFICKSLKNWPGTESDNFKIKHITKLAWKQATSKRANTDRSGIGAVVRTESINASHISPIRACSKSARQSRFALRSRCRAAKLFRFHKCRNFVVF